MSKRCSLSLREVSDLQTLEHTITKGLRAFYEVGQALAEIRDRKLYRAEHLTFEDYLEGRWGIGKSQGYRLIEAAEVVNNIVNNLSHNGTLPERASQALALADLSAEEQPEAWRMAQEASGREQPSTAQVEAAADDIADRVLGLEDLDPDEQREAVAASEKKISRTARKEARKEHLAAGVRCLRKARKWFLREGGDTEAVVAKIDEALALAEALE